MNISQAPADKVIADINKDFVAMNSHRIRGWYAWAILGIVAGMAVGIVYVANWSWQFDQGHAQNSAALVVKFSQSFPLGTIIYPIKFNPNAINQEKEWLFSQHYSREKVSDGSLSINLRYEEPSPSSIYEEDYIFGPNPKLGALAETPTGDLFISKPSLTNEIIITPTVPLGNLAKQSAKYKFTASFIGLDGKKVIAKIDDFWTEFQNPISGKNLKFANNSISVPGPVPILGFMTALVDDPDSPDDPFIYDASIYLPNQGSGSYEIVFQPGYEIFSQLHPNYSYFDIHQAWERGEWSNLKEIIFIPAKGGRGTSIKPKPIPRYIFGSGILNLSYVAPATDLTANKKQKQLGSIKIKNEAQDSSIIRGIGFTFLITNVTMPIEAKDINLKMEISKKFKKPTYFECNWLSDRSTLCKVWFDMKKNMKAGSVGIFPIISDFTKIPIGAIGQIDMKNTYDIEYQYGGKYIRYNLLPSQIPLPFAPIVF